MNAAYEVTITRYARAQLIEIGRYIASELLAPEAAEKVLDRLKAAVTSLSTLPARHPLIDEEPWRSEGIRKMVVSSYIVYYWIDEAAARVAVTAVVYAKREQLRQISDMMTHLSDDE